ncbi:MAG: hypothetical protein DIU79_02765 [Actinobacteria bacterium]|nr:MAG: hypothetical protein DIU79_02765 [Actinomycetota bacterium]
MAEPLTDDERATIKAAAFGAAVLVSNAEPGVLAMVRESFAASDVFAGATGLVRAVLTTGEVPTLPAGSPAELERDVLGLVERAVAILREKAPAELNNFRATLDSAVSRVAAAVGGVTAAESVMIEKIRRALGAGDRG